MPQRCLFRNQTNKKQASISPCFWYLCSATEHVLISAMNLLYKMDTVTLHSLAIDIETGKKSLAAHKALWGGPGETCEDEHLINDLRDDIETSEPFWPVLYSGARPRG